MDKESLAVEIRQEEPRDFPTVYDLNIKAFKRKDEARLVDRLRLSNAFVHGLSLVATVENKVVGHILFSRISIEGENGAHESLALAPMAVIPGMQRKGIGKQLIRHGLDKAKEFGFKSVMVLGLSDYYTRHGFVPASRWRIKPPFNAPENAFMGIELVEGALANVSGIIRFSREFGEI